MYRRYSWCKRPGQLSLVLLLVLGLALSGCQTGSTTVPVSPPLASSASGSISAVPGAQALKEAQNEFIAASKLVKPGETGAKLPAEARAKYQRVVDIVESQVLIQVTRDDLKVTAYALDAFSKWQLGNNVGAINTADQGKKLCRSAATNPRDCAMLQMDGGLVVASQTYEKYKDAPNMSREEVKNFANRMEAALNEIDEVNRMGDQQDPITIYANQWQLMIIREVTNFWYTYFHQDDAVWKPEVLKWLKRADQVVQKFPEAPYPNQDLTLRLKEEFDRLKKKAAGPA
jgi:hypothetical protein